MMKNLVFNLCCKDALWLDLGRFFLGVGIAIIAYVVSVQMFQT